MQERFLRLRRMGPQENTASQETAGIAQGMRRA